MGTKQFTKYNSSTEQAFTILDTPQPCSGCGQQTLTIFRGEVCSECARGSGGIRSVRLLT